jgi:hypothetical protein
MSDSFSTTANLDVVFPAGGGPVQLTEAQIAAVAGGETGPGTPTDGTSLK